MESFFDLYLAIASTSLTGWKSMLSIPSFGRFTLTEDGLTYAEQLYSYEILGNDGTIRRYLGCKLHHRILPSNDQVGREFEVKEDYQGSNRSTNKSILDYMEYLRKPPTVVYEGWMKVWYRKGRIHRDNDLPAIIYENGTQKWYKNGMIHRDSNILSFNLTSIEGEQKWVLGPKDNDKPAIIFADGTKVWYKYGQIHRDHDLPAIIDINGYNEWFIDGCRYRYNNFPVIIDIYGRDETIIDLLWGDPIYDHKSCDLPNIDKDCYIRRWKKI